MLQDHRCLKSCQRPPQRPLCPGALMKSTKCQTGTRRDGIAAADQAQIHLRAARPDVMHRNICNLSGQGGNAATDQTSPDNSYDDQVQYALNAARPDINSTRPIPDFMHLRTCSQYANMAELALPWEDCRLNSTSTYVSLRLPAQQHHNSIHAVLSTPVAICGIVYGPSTVSPWAQ